MEPSTQSQGKKKHLHSSQTVAPSVQIVSGIEWKDNDILQSLRCGFENFTTTTGTFINTTAVDFYYQNVDIVVRERIV